MQMKHRGSLGQRESKKKIIIKERENFLLFFFVKTLQFILLAASCGVCSVCGVWRFLTTSETN